MGLETATYVDDLVSTNPTSSDQSSQGDDHLRLLKAVLKASFPSVNRAFTLTKAAEYSNSVAAKTSNYTVVEADHGKVITMSASGGARTFTLPDPASVGAGWAVYLGKSDSSSNAVTIDSPASETINGESDWELKDKHDYAFVKSDGTNFAAMAMPGVYSSLIARTNSSNSFTGDQSITGDLTLTDTDAGASSGPVVLLDRNSASPADDDELGTIQFQGRNSANEAITYGEVDGQTQDVTDATEAGRLRFRTISGGSFASRFHVGAGLYAEGLDDPGGGKINAADYQINGDRAVQTVFSATQTVSSVTNIDFTAPFANVESFSLSLLNFTGSTTDALIVRIGDSDGIQTTGYNGEYNLMNSGGIVWPTSAVRISRSASSSNTMTGRVNFFCPTADGLSWQIDGLLRGDVAGNLIGTAGIKILPKKLTQVRATIGSGTVSGTARVEWRGYN